MDVSTDPGGDDLRAQRRGVQLEPDEARDPVHVHVVSEQGCPSAPSDGRDHAVDHPARSDSCRAATAVDPHGTVEVGHHVEAHQLEAQQQAAKVGLPPIVARAGRHLHYDGLGNGNGARGLDQLG